MSEAGDGKRELLRHMLATLAYRGGKTLRGAPETFAAFKAGETTRTPIEILAHVSDLLDWALSTARGAQAWHDTRPAADAWQQQVDRFHAALAAFDAHLASDAALGASPEKLFQGPIADALTHVGQLALLRRLSGAPIRGENYMKADIQSGHLGPDQPAPRREFG